MIPIPVVAGTIAGTVAVGEVTPLLVVSFAVSSRRYDLIVVIVSIQLQLLQLFKLSPKDLLHFVPRILEARSLDLVIRIRIRIIINWETIILLIDSSDVERSKY